MRINVDSESYSYFNWFSKGLFPFFFSSAFWIALKKRQKTSKPKPSCRLQWNSSSERTKNTRALQLHDIGWDGFEVWLNKMCDQDELFCFGRTSSTHINIWKCYYDSINWRVWWKKTKTKLYIFPKYSLDHRYECMTCNILSIKLVNAEYVCVCVSSNETGKMGSQWIDRFWYSFQSQPTSMSDNKMALMCIFSQLYICSQVETCMYTQIKPKSSSYV